jgi:hypothetical protein
MRISRRGWQAVAIGGLMVWVGNRAGPPRRYNSVGERACAWRVQHPKTDPRCARRIDLVLARVGPAPVKPVRRSVRASEESVGEHGLSRAASVADGAGHMQPQRPNSVARDRRIAAWRGGSVLHK